MRFIGIDGAAEPHGVAGVDEPGAGGLKPTPFPEDAEGYLQPFDRLGAPADTPVAREATGHSGDRGTARTAPLPGSPRAGLRRPPAAAPSAGGPGLSRSSRALGVIWRAHWPRRFPATPPPRPPLPASRRDAAHLRDEGRHTAGAELAQALLHAAARSADRHPGRASGLPIRFIWENRDVLRRLAGDIERLLNDHQVGSLLPTTADLGPRTAARLVAPFGDCSGFRDGAAVASSGAPFPASGSRGHASRSGPPRRPSATPGGAPHSGCPSATPSARTPWLRTSSEALIARGKLPKVALLPATRKLLHAASSVATHRRRWFPARSGREPAREAREEERDR